MILSTVNLTSEQVEECVKEQVSIQEDIEDFFCGDSIYRKYMGKYINQKIINFVRSGNYLTEWEMKLWGL